MTKACFSETSASFCGITRRQIPDDSTHHNNTLHNAVNLFFSGSISPHFGMLYESR
jgi:hypothetical protein